MARKKIDKSPVKQPLFDDLSPHARQAIGAVVMGTLGVFFLFALFESAGPAGHYIEIALRYLFGGGAWLAPIACFLYIYVLLNPKENETVSAAKVMGTILLFLTLLGSLELYQEKFGGIVGLALEWPMTYLMGTAVTGILFFGTILISIFLIFNTGLKLPTFAGAKNLLKGDENGDGFDDEELEDFDALEDVPKKGVELEGDEDEDGFLGSSHRFNSK